MSRPKTYQAATVSTWCGLAYRIARPCKIKDGRWKTTLYLLTPRGNHCRKEGPRCAAKRGGGAELTARAEREIQRIAIEHADVILDAVRSGTWPWHDPGELTPPCAVE